MRNSSSNTSSACPHVGGRRVNAASYPPNLYLSRKPHIRGSPMVDEMKPRNWLSLICRMTCSLVTFVMKNVRSIGIWAMFSQVALRFSTVDDGATPLPEVMGKAGLVLLMKPSETIRRRD